MTNATRVLAAVGLAVALWIAAAPASASAPASPPDCRLHTPRPDDAKLTPPGPEVPAEVARYAGVWTGAWLTEQGEDALCSSLIVERVHGNGFAEVIYSYGAYEPWNLLTPGYFRAAARVTDGVLRFRSGNGDRFAFTHVADGLTATYNGDGDARFGAAEGLHAVGCTGGPKGPGTPAGTVRTEMTFEELMTPPQDGGRLVHNSHFMPSADARPARHAFTGALLIGGGTFKRTAHGCPGMERQSNPVSISFFTEGDHLVPVARDIVHPPGTGGRNELIFSPGRVWSEPGDRGMSRAAFPFVITTQISNETHNGLATFLFDDARVSGLRFQIVQETAGWNRYDAWGTLPLSYTPGPVANDARLRAAFRKELDDRWPIRPFSDLAERLGTEVADAFAGYWGREHVSTTGLAIDGTVYLAPCPTRWGPFPFCDQMRHGVFSVTKSAAAALSLMRLAKKYGDQVLDLKIKDYVDVAAAHDGWDDVTFADALNMATGIGDKAPDPKPDIAPRENSETFFRWMRARPAQDKLTIAFTWGDYPWGPGRFARYDTTHTFILAAAMDAFVKRQEGADANLWDMIVEEVLRPIGVHHAPLMHTVEPDGTRGIPVMGYGLYPTVEDAAKIAALIWNGGRHDDRQLLSSAAVRQALYRTDRRGLPTGGENRYGAESYHMSFWYAPYRAEAGCRTELPAMFGFGGNIVVIFPNGVVGFRFADAWNYEIKTIAAAAEAVRPFCAPEGTLSAETPTGVPLTAADLRRETPGATFYGRDWHLYMADDGRVFGAGTDDRVRLGTWRITDQGRFCARYIAHRDGSERCSTVTRDGDEYTIYPDQTWDEITMRRVAGNPEGY